MAYINGKTNLPEKLEKIHHTAARMLGRGHRIKEVCAKVQKSESTVLRWKRDQRFKDLIAQHTPKGEIQKAIQEQSENYDILQSARETEVLMTAELRETVETLIAILKEALENLPEEERKNITLRQISPLLKVASDSLGVVQASHDRLSGYGALMKELESILGLK